MSIRILLVSMIIVAPMVIASTGCTTIGQLPPQGIIWLNHHDLVVKDTDRITSSTNGTSVFLTPKPGIAFPERDLVPIHASTLPPGFYITGVRVCYGIVGDHADTEVHRLRLAQFDSDWAGGPIWPGYVVRLEATNTGSLAPTPPPGGFAYDEGAGFVCVDSASDTGQPCLDPGKGTVAAETGVQIGDQDDRLVIQAVGVHYDLTCTPN